MKISNSRYYFETGQDLYFGQKKHHERSSQLLQQIMEPSKFQVCDLRLLQRLRRQPQVLGHLFS